MKDEKEEEIELIYFKSSSKMSSSLDNLKKSKIRNKRRSISYFQNNNQQINIFLKTQTIRKDKKSSERLILNSQTNEIEKIKKNDTKKNNLLTTINKNIERNQINLNNPELFYSEYFHKILDKKKAEHGEDHPLNKEMNELINKLHKKSSFSMLASMKNNIPNQFISE